MKKIYLFLIFSSIFSFSQTNYQRMWGTYFGCNDFVMQKSILDHDGNIYIAGIVIKLGDLSSTYQDSYATSGAHLQTCGNGSFIIVKFSPQGTVLWSTFLDTLNGTSFNSLSAIAIDSNNNLYLSGFCAHTVVPIGGFTGQGIVTEPVDFELNNNGFSSFLTKFSSSGVQQWGKFIPGIVTKIIFDENDAMYMSGGTYNLNSVATANAFQSNFINYANCFNYFIFKYTTQGVKIWGTYYGYDNLWGAVTLLRYPKLNITTDATGNLYVAGNIHLYTFNNYATVGCFQNDADYPHTDMNSSCFISKFNPSGQRIWSTYYALNNNLASTIVDDIMYYDNYIYFTGITNAATGIATPGAYQTVKSGLVFNGTDTRDGYDAYLTKFDLNGNRIWGTYCGGSLEDRINNIDIKNSGIFIAGTTKSPDGISTSNGFQNTLSTPLSSSPVQYLYDAFVAKFDFAGNKTWGTYYGGNKNEISGNDSDITFPHTTVLINNSGTFYIAGETASENNIATAGSFQPSWNNLPNTNPNLYQEASNFYLAKFDPVPLSNQSFTFKELHYFPNPAKNTITISNASIIDSVDVISVLGQKISSKMGNNKEIQLDLSGLSNGVYFIKVYSNNDNSTFKIIKE